MSLTQNVLASVRTPLPTLMAQDYDLLIIGGGITGAGILRDAAMRGLTVAMVDRGDFGIGTSSRSSRLVHGGLRYLEHFQWKLVREALSERRVLLNIAPHLVHRLPFVLPSHAGDRVPRWKLAVGLGLYGLLATGGNVARPRTLGKAGVLALEPNLRARGLRGGGVYTDAQCDDARLVVATIRSGVMHGGRVCNYLEVTDLTLTGNRITGVSVADRLTGAIGSIVARTVVNATGPWTDQVRRLEDPAATPLLRLTKGSHVVVLRSRIGHRHGITFTSPIDGRVMFILPWGEHSYIGTTDTDHHGDPGHVRVDDAEMNYLLRSANAIFPHAHLGPEDVVASWAGLRPLLAGDPALPTAAVSREHRILTGPRGMITVAGGKLTTYRLMAADAVDAVVQSLQQLHGLPSQMKRPATDTEPLPGGESDVWDPFLRAGLELGLTTAHVEHLLWHYGTETEGILNLIRGDRRLGDPVHPAHPAVGAEVIHAVRREFACRVADVLVRRVHVATETSDRGVAAAAAVAAIMGREQRWTPAQVEQEVQRYTEEIGTPVLYEATG
jgi:glycerol-3-phosphate dehydrogenase